MALEYCDHKPLHLFYYFSIGLVFYGDRVVWKGLGLKKDEWR